MNKVSCADVTDATVILELQKRAYQSEAILYNDWTIPPLTQTLGEVINEFDEKTFLKICGSDGIIGSVRASMKDGTCYVGCLIVHPELQHQGIGTLLMLAIEREFTTAGRFELFTGSRSEGNVRLYERLGYRPYRTECLSPKVELIFMEKKVNKR